MSAPLSVAEMIGNIVEAERRGRPMVAGFGLVRLREFLEFESRAAGQKAGAQAGKPESRNHDATNPSELWADFARKNIPLGRDRVDELIGTMVHRNNLIRCVKCGVAVKCPCGCGAPYASEHPWLSKKTALERRARGASPVESPVDERVGRNGRRRKLRTMEVSA